MTDMDQTARDVAAAIRSTFNKLPQLPDADSNMGVSAHFRDQQNHAAGVRAPHAFDALKSATCDHWQMGAQGRVSLCRATPTSSRAYGLLMVTNASPETGGATLIDHAWRLYGDHWPDDPTDAFGALLSEFGLDVNVGDERRRFVPVMTEPSDGREVMFSFDAVPGMSAAVYVSESVPTSFSWIYAVDYSAYAAWVNRLR